MKYLYSWLKEFDPTLGTIEDTVARMIQLGHDVSDVQPITFDNIIVGVITAVEAHPNADRLSYVAVHDGTNDFRVVCGAPHLEVGQKVAYAKVGTVLPCGITLRQATIRGIVSDGMLCAEDELGIGPSHEGLLSIPSDAELGTALADVVSADAIIHVDVTPNRGDVLSHFGMARDLHAIDNAQVLEPALSEPRYSGSGDVVIAAPHADTYALSLGIAKLSENTKLPATPLLMASRLNLLGQKLVNCAVDLTNYMMLAYGQPLHVYDMDKLGDKPIITVRRAHVGEAFRGLGDQHHNLGPESLVVTAHDLPVALAGILGGDSSKATESTTNFLFEAAIFDARAIKAAADHTKCYTESSQRFIRGIDPQLHDKVLAHTQAVFQTLTQSAAYNPVTYISPSFVSSHQATSIRADYFTRFTGKPTPTDRLEAVLGGLGIIYAIEDDSYTVTPPQWRFDLALPIDYVEEWCRVIGIDTIAPAILPASVPQWKRSKWWRQEWLKDTLVSLGAMEIATYPFMSKQDYDLFTSSTDPLTLRESPQEDRPWLRHTLIPGGLQAVAANPEVPFFLAFEIANVFKDVEVQHIAILAASNTTADVDAWWSNFFERLRLPVASWMGRVKVCEPHIIEAYKIRKHHVTVLELPIDTMLVTNYDIPNVVIPDLNTIQYTPRSKYQASRRDVAVLVDSTVDPNAVLAGIRNLDTMIVDADLFDRYTDEKLGEGKQSLAFRLMYQAEDHTLTETEIEALHLRVTTYLEEHYHATVR